jgi:hypothetical protein
LVQLRWLLSSLTTLAKSRYIGQHIESLMALDTRSIEYRPSLEYR